jgi:hypothetical protein
MPNNYVLLETIALTQSAASVTFDNLPTSGYTDLKVVASTRTDYAGFLDLNMYFNGNASSGYSWRRLNGDGGSATSTNSTSAGIIPSPTLGTTSTANTFASTDIYIPNYRSSVAKSVSIDAVTENNATTSYQTFTAGLSTLSTPITSVSFGLGAGNFVANTTFSLYGIAALGTTPVLAPKATGGNIVANDGTYWYHAFTSSGFFTPQIGINCDVLVVAGGGGGGDWASGGGGAGGVSYISSLALNSSTAVTIGAGGAQNNAGSNSIFGSIISNGGGRGGSNSSPANGGTGGSGGGAAINASGGSANQGNTGGATGYGNNGGTSTSAAEPYASAGGGGAGGVGTSVSGGAGGAGGIGITNSTINTLNAFGAATLTGQLSGGNYYYAGGGGGASSNGGAAGGLGGGGAGINNAGVAATAGTANTGGGGGGQRQLGTGGAGGSGIVIIRYPIA